MRYSLFLLLLVFTGFAAVAQVPGQTRPLAGRIFKKGTRDILYSVSIHNLSTQKYNLSDHGGNFVIQASPGDTLVFSSAGYQTDTLYVDEPMFKGEYQVYLEPRIVALPSVLVGGMSNYQLDSMERRRDYDWVYGRYDPVGPLVDKHRQGDGVGVNMNLPIRSSTDKQIIKLKKRLNQEEEDYYIDSRFTSEYVSRLTRLKGDSLQTFMVKYRPTYKFCRLATNQDILLWINDSYKKYMKQ